MRPPSTAIAIGPRVSEPSPRHNNRACAVGQYARIDGESKLVAALESEPGIARMQLEPAH